MEVVEQIRALDCLRDRCEATEERVGPDIIVHLSAHETLALLDKVDRLAGEIADHQVPAAT